MLVDKEAYVEAKKVVSKLIRKERAKYYQTVIEQNQSNPKKMFTVISGLLGKDDGRSLPPCRQRGTCVSF